MNIIKPLAQKVSQKLKEVIQSKKSRTSAFTDPARRPLEMGSVCILFVADKGDERRTRFACGLSSSSSMTGDLLRLGSALVVGAASITVSEDILERIASKSVFEIVPNLQPPNPVAESPIVARCAPAMAGFKE